MYLAIALILLGAGLWIIEENKKIVNGTIVFSIMVILIGAILLFLSLHKPSTIKKETRIEIAWWHYFFILGLIFLGSMSYTVAAYFHLKLENWTFLSAFLIAVPFLLVEYQFSLRGNYYAKKHLNMNVIQITLLTLIFYFFNAWLLNHFVLKHTIVWWREIMAFLFIFIAFFITTQK